LAPRICGSSRPAPHRFVAAQAGRFFDGSLAVVACESDVQVGLLRRLRFSQWRLKTSGLRIFDFDRRNFDPHGARRHGVAHGTSDGLDAAGRGRLQHMDQLHGLHLMLIARHPSVLEVAAVPRGAVGP
jgi:hypothetical protein